MGWLKRVSGGSSKSAYGGWSYGSGPSVSVPDYATSAAVAAGDVPKAAETPDMSAFEASERRRLASRGVRGTFTE